MTIVDPSDLSRYSSGYALITTPAELALRKELGAVLSAKIQNITLTEEERTRIAARLRASHAAAFTYEPAVPDVQ